MRRVHIWLVVSTIVFANFVARPTFASDNDRKVAQQIADVMRASGAMKDYDLAVKFSNGTAWLRGSVTNPRQMGTAVEIAEASPYVDQVVNQIKLRNQQPASPRTADPASAHARSAWASGTAAPDAPAASKLSRIQSAKPLKSISENLAKNRNARRDAAPVLPQQPGMAVPMPLPASTASTGPKVQFASRRVRAMPRPMAAAYGQQQGGPQPAYVPGTGGGVAPASYDQPNMPGYAWPSYAPYPNYSALTYPRQYSPTAWPYIGPFYPYPQVPLGWRKVSLEWDDGWWMLDFRD